MTDLNPDFRLDGPPGPDAIASFREQAQEEERSVIAAYRTDAGEKRFVVVSDRGTCVLLDDRVTVETFNRDVDSAAIADALSG